MGKLTVVIVLEAESKEDAEEKAAEIQDKYPTASINYSEDLS